MTTPAPQTNGVAAKDQSPSTSQPHGSQPSQPSQSQPPQEQSQAGGEGAAGANAGAAAAGTLQNGSGNGNGNGAGASAQPAPKPRDARTMELLLTAQGVTAYEARVPQMLLDFAYRHTSSILSDAVHLSGDPHTSNAGGAKAAAAAAYAPANGDAAVSANAIRLAIASRLSFQFGGGAGGVPAGDSFSSTGGGGPSKEWLLELARERNKVALPRVGAIEWGARLPSERFVLSGVGWGLRDSWAPGAAADDDDDDEDDDDDDDVVEGVHGGVNGRADVAMADGPAAAEDVGGDGVEGGTIDDVFEDDGMMEDEEMEM